MCGVAGCREHLNPNTVVCWDRVLGVGVRLGHLSLSLSLSLAPSLSLCCSLFLSLSVLFLALDLARSHGRALSARFVPSSLRCELNPGLGNIWRPYSDDSYVGIHA